MKNIHSHERDAKIMHLCAHTKVFSCLFMHSFIILININEFILIRKLTSYNEYHSSKTRYMKLE